MDLQLFRKTAKIKFSLWASEKKAIFEITPVLPDAPKGQPKKGDSIYDYDKKVTIGFNANEMLIWSYHFLNIAMGGELEKPLVKYADTSKVEGNTDGELKSLTIGYTKDGKGVNFSLSVKEGNRASATIDPSDVYTFSKWLEFAYNALFLDHTMRKATEDDSKKN